MTPSDESALNENIGLVSELARLMGDVAVAYYRTNVSIEAKGDGSPVTIADRDAELAARRWIRDRFPNDGVLGEEYGEDGLGARRRWIIDPIDGTKAFVRGVPLWGSLVALCEGESVVAGAACFPVVNELIAAARGAGCWLNGSRCAVSSVDSLEHATVLTTDDRFHERRSRGAGWQRLADAAGLSRTWGDCFGYLLVATGRAEAMVDPVVSAWDVAALQVIVTEAGGSFTDWDGQQTPFGGSAIATNRALAAPIRSLLADSETT